MLEVRYLLCARLKPDKNSVSGDLVENICVVGVVWHLYYGFWWYEIQVPHTSVERDMPAMMCNAHMMVLH